MDIEKFKFSLYLGVWLELVEGCTFGKLVELSLNLSFKMTLIYLAIAATVADEGVVILKSLCICRCHRGKSSGTSEVHYMRRLSLLARSKSAGE